VAVEGKGRKTIREKELKGNNEVEELREEEAEMVDARRKEKEGGAAIARWRTRRRKRTRGERGYNKKKGEPRETACRGSCPAARRYRAPKKKERKRE